LKQPLQAWFGKFSSIVACYDLWWSFSDHFILVQKNSTNTTILFRLFNDIVLTKDDHQKIIQLKAYLTSHFHIKNLGLLRYFLRIKVTQSSKSLSLSQWKYYTNLLKETDMLGSKPIITPMDPGVCFNQHLGEALADPR